MMKWRRKKTSPSSSLSSRIPSLSRVLPTAWLSTFKRMSINSEIKPAKGKPKEVRNSMSVSSSKFAAAGCGGRERFYGGVDAADVFWRLSFGEDSADRKTSQGVSLSAWYDSDDELDSAPSSYRSCGSNAIKGKEKEDTKKFSNTAFDVIMMKEFRRDTQILPDMKLKKTNEGAMQEKKLKRRSGEAQQKAAKYVEKNTLELEPMRTIPMIEGENLKSTGDYQRRHQHLCTMNLRTSNLTTIKEDSAFTAERLAETDLFSQEKLRSEWEKWEEMKIEKAGVKSKKQRKSVYMSRELPRRRMKQNNKVRVFSPRTASKVEICKIKALEDIKKDKLKMKASRQKTISGRTGLENFAVMKCSFEPEKDFRDSMIEMIREKRISRPEELLACCLTLNSDAYHDLIIRVFQQVLFNLDQASSDTDFTE